MTDPDLVLLQTEVPDHGRGHGDDLRISLGCGAADELGSELEELPVPSALGPLVPEALAEVEDLDGLGIVAHAVDEHPDGGCGHLGTEGDLPVTLVLECVELLEDVRSGAEDEKLRILEDGGLDLPESEGAGGMPELVLIEPAFLHLIGEEIPGTAGTLYHAVRITIPHLYSLSGRGMLPLGDGR